jgi:hypothetical protein
MAGNSNSVMFLCCSNPREKSTEKIKQLEDVLTKRSGTVIPSSHQILIDLKTDLGHFYDTTPSLASGKRRLELLRERIGLLAQIEGETTDSRLKGFLQFRLHNLLVEKVAILQRKGVLTEDVINEIGPQLAASLKESVKVLMHDQGCPPQLMQTISSLAAQQQ